LDKKVSNHLFQDQEACLRSYKTFFNLYTCSYFPFTSNPGGCKMYKS